MTADIKLLPLPKKAQLANPYASRGIPTPTYGHSDETLTDYARANVAHAAEPLKAEIEALRAEREVIGAEALKYAGKSGRLEARAEQLEVALWKLASAADDFTAHTDDEDEIGYRPCCGVLSYKPHEDGCAVTKARAALAVQPQENGNGE